MGICRRGCRQGVGALATEGNRPTSCRAAFYGHIEVWNRWAYRLAPSWATINYLVHHSHRTCNFTLIQIAKPQKLPVPREKTTEPGCRTDSRILRMCEHLCFRIAETPFSISCVARNAGP